MVCLFACLFWAVGLMVLQEFLFQRWLEQFEDCTRPEVITVEVHGMFLQR